MASAWLSIFMLGKQDGGVILVCSPFYVFSRFSMHGKV